jgi:histidine triad (HIT) family protein
MKSEPDCIFCNIIEKKAQAEIVYEDSQVIAFLDIRPLTYGHTLVVPKIHCKNILTVPEEYFHQLFKVVQNISKGLVKSFNLDGFNVISNNGIVAGQSVFHFHFHVIPRFHNDGHKIKLDLKKYNEGEMKEYADKIRKALDN